MWPPRTLAITDRRRLGARSERDEDARLVAFVAAMAFAGVDAVQVRERDWPDARLLGVVRASRAAVSGTTCRLFVNEPGVVVFFKYRPGRRTYRTLRIPESVAERVHSRLRKHEA